MKKKEAKNKDVSLFQTRVTGTNYTSESESYKVFLFLETLFLSSSCLEARDEGIDGERKSVMGDASTRVRLMLPFSAG